MQILYTDAQLAVCVKPPRVLSTDEPGGLPELLRRELNCPHGDFRTVHRLDRVVSGLMVLARDPQSAAALSGQIREGTFQKSYLAVIHGCPQEAQGAMEDLLVRDKARKMTFVASAPGKGIQEAKLHYEVLKTAPAMSLVRIRLQTGRTHQIRVQFSSRGLPLIGERKYAALDDGCEIALWSYCLGFFHPASGRWMEFTLEPPGGYPWDQF